MSAWDIAGSLSAARSPKLRRVLAAGAGAGCWRRVLAAASTAGHAYVVIDGRSIPIGRVAADRPLYSGKHRRHRMNLQVTSSGNWPPTG